MSVVLAPATHAEGQWVARHIRHLDREELRLTGAPDPGRAIRNAIDLSDGYALIATVEDHPIAVLGVAPSYGIGEAMPWMLGTPEVARHGKELLSLSRTMIKQWLDDFPLLMNEVWVGNKPSMAYLRRVGFEFAQPRQNAYGAQMAVFYMRRS
jgi:hypothetical protein